MTVKNGIKSELQVILSSSESMDEPGSTFLDEVASQINNVYICSMDKVASRVNSVYRRSWNNKDYDWPLRL